MRLVTKKGTSSKFFNSLIMLNVPCNLKIKRKGESFMLKYLKAEANAAFTENGAMAFATTESDCLDLFATVGALRYASDDEIEKRFMRAYAENKDIATKLLFFARDVRGGLGERRVFRIILHWLTKNAPETVRKNVGKIAEYGRYDDLLVLLGTSCEAEALSVIGEQFRCDMSSLENGGEVSLLGKWLPSVNASNTLTVINAKKVARYLGMNDREYRKSLVALRERIKIIENNLRTRDYTFDYSKQTSSALYRYRKAFLRNDGTRYIEFLKSAREGSAKLNASNVMPYELIKPLFTSYGDYIGYQLDEGEIEAINTTWQNLPNYCGMENSLPVIDLSGSMYFNAGGMPAMVALSLGIYAAERNGGIFKNHFISFSEKARLIEVKGNDFTSKVQYVSSFNEIANTNLENVFDLILNAALKNQVSQNELPARLIIISDMEFDRCVDSGNQRIFEYEKAKYASYGYKLPEVVFWNVASRNMQHPVTVNESGVSLVSGCTPRIFSMVAKGSLSPYVFMLEVLRNERYSQIVA